MGACCYRACKSLIKGGGEVKDVVFQPPTLSNDWKGPNAKVDYGRILSGRGAVLGTEAISPQGLYYEVKVRTPGSFACGIMEFPNDPSKDLDRAVCDNKKSFGLKSDILAADTLAGDVLGVYVEMSESGPHLSFALNGLPLSDLYDVPKPGSSMKIPVAAYYPVCYVKEGAMVEVSFEERHWKYPPDLTPEEEAIVTT